MTADKNLKLIAVADAFENRVTSSIGALRKQFADQVDVPKERMFVGLQRIRRPGTDAAMVVLATRRLPPDTVSGGHRRGQTRLHGEAVLRRRSWLPHSDGNNKKADEKNLLVGVGLQRRHEPQYIEAVKQLQDGSIGDINLLRVYWNGSGIWNRKREEGMTECSTRFLTGITSAGSVATILRTARPQSGRRQLGQGRPAPGRSQWHGRMH